jgi:hypothetical protein
MQFREINPKILLLRSTYGSVAEWLGRALQKLLQRFESARNLCIFETYKVDKNLIGLSFGMMKYSNYIGIAAAIVLMIACFLPWAYYPDLDKNFTGFFSENNNYGKPGKVFFFFAITIIILAIIPRVWAKRANQFIGVLVIAYAIKTFILFTSCYSGVCPEKKIGLWVMMLSCIVMLIATMLPNLKNRDF